jgi:hypothetical protein
MLDARFWMFVRVRESGIEHLIREYTAKAILFQA